MDSYENTIGEEGNGKPASIPLEKTQSPFSGLCNINYSLFFQYINRYGKTSTLQMCKHGRRPTSIWIYEL